MLSRFLGVEDVFNTLSVRGRAPQPREMATRAARSILETQSTLDVRLPKFIPGSTLAGLGQTLTNSRPGSGAFENPGATQEAAQAATRTKLAIGTPLLLIGGGALVYFLFFRR